MLRLSFIIPVYNSEQTIQQVCERLIDVLGNHIEKYTYEIILINDYSLDNSLEKCKRLAEINNNIKLVSFARNFGKHHGLMAGYRASSGDYIICLDDDLQNPPEEIFKLIKGIEQGGYDVVFGKPLDKKHSKFKNFGSLINKKMAEILIGKPKNLYISSYFILRKYIVDEIIKYDNPYPYIEGLILRTTKNIGNVEVIHRDREVGKSNFTIMKCIKLWLNGFTNFSIKPLRVATYIGFLLFVFSTVISIGLVIRKLFMPEIQLGYTSIMVVMIFFGAIQLLSIGLLGEYIGRIFIAINKAPQYVIKETVNVENKSERQRGD